MSESIWRLRRALITTMIPADSLRDTARIWRVRDAVRYLIAWYGRPDTIPAISMDGRVKILHRHNAWV